MKCLSLYKFPLCRLLVVFAVMVAGAVSDPRTAVAQNPLADKVRGEQKKKAAAPVRNASAAARKAAAAARQAPKPAPKKATPRPAASAPQPKKVVADSVNVAPAAKGLPEVPDKLEETADSAAAANKVYEVVEQKPAYPGGEAALMRDLALNVRYPAVAQENGTQGRVIVQFVVETTGEIGELKVIRSLSRECDQAAMAAVRKLKRFVPGRQGGRAVRVSYRLPVTFRLQ